MAWWHRIGQRVKKVRQCAHTRLYHEVLPGTEGQITSIPGVASSECSIVYQGFGTRVFAGMWENLEPIMPEGNKVVSWSECLWQPSHLKEDAGVNQYS